MRNYKKWHYPKRWHMRPRVRVYREHRHEKQGTFKGMLDTALSAIGVLSMVVFALVTRRK